MPQYDETIKMRKNVEDMLRAFVTGLDTGIDIWEGDYITSLRYILCKINDEEIRLAINIQHRKDYPEQYKDTNK